MKYLYLGSAISQATADDITLKSKVKPSVAPVNLQRNLLKGFSKWIAPDDFSVLSLPPIGMYPGGCYFGWGSRREEVSGYTVQYIPALNLPIFKQTTVFFSTLFLLIKWGIRNRKEKEKVIITYGQTLYINLAQQFFCRLFRVKSCNIVTDPIRYRGGMEKLNVLARFFVRVQWRLTEYIKKGYAAFILLTEPMVKEYIDGDTPYIIMEGIADTAIFDGIGEPEKAEPPVLMYSGALSPGFGLPRLLESLQYMKRDYRLWLFGDKKYLPEIEKAQLQNDRIRFWGKVPWNELLTHMKEASLLLSVKPVDASHSAHQFPSKIMEYMASGTPVLATRVQGIPTEYFEYIYAIGEDSPTGFAEAMDAALALPAEVLKEKGEKARNFIEENKNCYLQAERVIRLAESVVRK